MMLLLLQLGAGTPLKPTSLLNGRAWVIKVKLKVIDYLEHLRLTTTAEGVGNLLQNHSLFLY